MKLKNDMKLEGDFNHNSWNIPEEPGKENWRSSVELKPLKL